MKTSNSQKKIQGFLTAGAAMGALLIATTAHANGTTAAAAASDGSARACSQETQRVALWPKGNPKFPQHARYEMHEVTVCNGKVVSSQPLRNASTAKNASR
jgi:hypothetical protein